ncbi:unnamed protein product [Lactuca virosa]|uniref:Uncharacterized protein n=1 Tax=Lactuca virosa TaxID=75947 RepID=A0AAU9M235_9ASTR|nr:unnamed protein product [Lactuca virosa]
MVNEEDEETYYHGTQLHYDDTFTYGMEGEVGRTPTGKNVEPSPDVGQHDKKQCLLLLGRNERGVLHDPIHTKIEENHQTKEKKAVECLEKANEDIVNEESNDVSNHLLLDNLYAASTLGFWKE